MGKEAGWWAEARVEAVVEVVVVEAAAAAMEAATTRRRGGRSSAPAVHGSAPLGATSSRAAGCHSLADYAPGGRYYNHLPPQGRGAGGHAAPAGVVLGAQPPPAAVHEHLFAHDDAEEAAYIAQATAESEASIAARKRRDDEEIAAQMAVFRARERRERAAKRARIDGAGPSYAVDSAESE